MQSPHTDLFNMIKKTLTAIGWVPNISGLTTDPNNLRSKIVDIPISVNGSEWLMKYKGNVIKVYDESRRESAEISPMDSKGFCCIYCLSESPVNAKDYEVKRTNNDIWEAFRSQIDGCSELWKCTAMDRPIPYTEDDAKKTN